MAAPRRKFTLQGEIKCALQRFKYNYTGSWNFIPDRAILRKITQLYSEKFLYVKGSKFETLGLQRPELLAYMHSLPHPERKELPTGSKLRSTPLFYSSVQFRNSISGKLEHIPKTSLKELHWQYDTCEAKHKAVESHHPDGIGWNGGIDSTIECVFDVYNSLLRQNSVKNSYNKLLNILLDDKFANLDTDGILFAILHIIIRGVANSEIIYTYSNWRRGEISQELCWKVSQDFANGVPPHSLISQYKRETLLHVDCMRLELTRLRINKAQKQFHDYTKLSDGMTFYYAWYWGVFQRFTKNNQQLFDLGLDLNNHPTMFSLGRNAMEGALSTPEFSEVLAFARQTPEVIAQKVLEASEVVLDRVEHISEEREKSMKETAQEILKEFKDSTRELVTESIEKLVEKSKKIGEGLSEAFTPMLDLISSLKGMVSGVVDQVNGFLRPFVEFTGVKLNVESILEALKYYVLYVNTESTSLKMILVFLLLNSLGLIGKFYEYVLDIWRWSSSTTVEGEIVQAQETSMLEWITASPQNLLNVVAGVFASIAKQSSLSMSQFFSLTNSLASKMRNFHFIGAGMAGIARIFEYGHKFWNHVCEWISVNIFGKTAKKTEAAKRVIKLLIKIKYFSSESGLNAIRASEKVRQQAEKIMPEWLELITITRSDPELRTMFMDLDRNSRQVKDIADFITRFRAVSNFQPTMFHIQLVGRPGIGKSTITKNLVNDLTHSLWPEEPKASFYSLNMNLEYFDGYAGQKIMIADDVYKMNEPKHLTATIGLITNTPVILPMANLADKGVQMTSEIFLSSTNTAYPLGKDILCMEAVHRRRHMLVEVTCDDRVIDKGAGQFSKSLYDKHYPGIPLSKMPHLKFGLLKPVPREFGGAAEEVHVDEDEFKQYMEYADLLKKANYRVSTALGELDPTFYFSEDNIPPGITYPASGWTYEQFISNCVVRFRAFRGMEGTYSNQVRYCHVENCLAEIDMILDNSNKNDIFRPLDQFLTQIQHPYGTDDPIGERIMQGVKLAPELEDIDFDNIVDSIIEDSKPTGVTLEEECNRRRRIMEARKKRILAPEIRDCLKVELLEGKHVLSLEDHPTYWDDQGELGAELQKVFVAACKVQMDRIQVGQCEETKNWPQYMNPQFTNKEHLTMVMEFLMGSEITYKNRMYEFLTSDNLVYPEGFPKAGEKSNLPIALLHRIKKIGNRWFLDVEDFGFFEPQKTIRVRKNGRVWNIPLDVAYILNLSTEFRLFLSEFNLYTESQRLLLIEEAGFRNRYFGTYTFEKIALDCKNLYSKFTYQTLHYLTSPINWMVSKFPYIASIAAYLLSFVAVIWAIRQISQLFAPKPTSKVLHRGPQSSIIYSGRPTSCSLSSVADPLIKRNVKRVVLTDSHMSAQGQALVTEQYILLNKHLTKWISDEEFEITIYSDQSQATHIIPKQNLYEDPEGDLAIIFSRYIPAARNISHHFMTNQEFKTHEFEKPTAILTRKEEYATMEYFSTVGKCENLILRTTGNEMKLAEVVMLSGRTVLGNSGSTVITDIQGQTRIIGIQAWEIDALYSPKIAVQVITQEKFQMLTEKLQAQCSDTIIKRLWEPTPDTTMQPTGAFEYVPEENLIAMDEHSVGDVARNLIQPSFISAHLTKEGIETKRIPAAMSDRDPRLYHEGEIHPLAHSLGKYFRGEMKPISSNTINRAKHMLIKYITNRLDTTNFNPLDINDTITGTREDGSNPMNLKSSPGIPFIFDKREKKGKKDFMEIGEDGEISHLDENFISDYLKFEQTLGRGQVPYTRAYDFPKDELRPIDKALGTNTTPPKTRSVTCMNVFYILAWRRYTLRFWSAMHRAADGNFTFCPGINPEGPEWNTLYHYLNKHPNAVDFDVSNWDGVYFSQLFYNVLDIIKEVMRIKPKTYENNILDSIFYDVMNCYIQFGNTIYQKSRGLVSGFPGTAEVNTLGHWLLFLSIYLKLTAGTSFSSFMAYLTNISACIYGDDILITFSDDIKDVVNGLSLKKGYEEIGYTITSATKSKEVELSKSLLECQFLKATWRPLISGYYVRKMDMDVAHDLVHWVRAKNEPRTQFFDNYIDALHIAFGNGEQAFNKFQNAVNKVLKKVGEGNIYYTYKDFEYDYYNRYFSDFNVSVKYF